MVPTNAADPIFTGITPANVTYYTDPASPHPNLAAGATLLATDGAGHNLIAQRGRQRRGGELLSGYGQLGPRQ